MFASNFAPRGWGFCNGQLLQIAQNTALFSIIGTTYGGDGRTTTGLPDLRGRAPLHPGRGPGLTPRRLGEKGGQDNVALSVQTIPAHKHTVNCQQNAGNAGGPAGHIWAADSSGFTKDYSDQGANATMAAGAIANAGGGQGHPNMPPFLAVSFIIALTGLYPSR
jgi:microcystin-dependent protein